MRTWVRPHFSGWRLEDALYYAAHVCLRDSGRPVHERRSVSSFCRISAAGRRTSVVKGKVAPACGRLSWVFLLPFLKLVFPLCSEASYDRETLVVQEENRAGLWPIHALDHTRNCGKWCGARRIRNIEDLVFRFSRRSSTIRGNQQQGAGAVRLRAGRVQVLWFAF